MLGYMKRDYNFLKTHVPEIITEGDMKQYAVSIVLPDTDNEEEILFEVRSDKIRQQPGDVCLPGGAVEPGETPETAVIREISEELMIDKDQIEMIGPVHIFVAGLRELHVFLCRVKGYENTFNSDEVAEVFRVPVSFFLKTEPAAYDVNWFPKLTDVFPFDKIYGGQDYVWRELTHRILFYEYGNHVIWGITAGILSGFVKVMAGVSPKVIEGVSQRALGE